MPSLQPITSIDDVPAHYQDTPIARLFEYHNLGRPFEKYASAEILIGMCMDNRKRMRVPDNWAFILRTGGTNLRYSKFHVSYAVAVARITAIALIAHTNCGMSGLINRREAFVQGLVEHAGWSRQRAEEHFMNYAPMYEIEEPVEFVASEAQRMRGRYPTLTVAPLLYKLEDDLLYLIDEE
jgi:carbonic anhydrase